MPIGSKSLDGSFRLFYRNGWAYLIVYPPQEGGKPVYPEEVESRMKLLKVPPVSTKRIREIIQAAEGKATLLVEWPDGLRLASEITVEIASDAMSASIIVSAPKKGAAPPTVDDIKIELRNNGVVFGIKEETIERLLSQRLYGEKIVVSEGAEPIDGKSATVRYHFNINRGKPYLEMEFGRINLKELNFIDNKHQGDLLAELLPPVTPKDGKTVTGTVIPAQSDMGTIQLPAGKNTRLNEDKTGLYAVCDGNVKLHENLVIIEPVVTVENINYETGNIYFEGSVVVTKGIADGFIVEADGDIQVGKGVGKATLKAGGNILLKTGINGNKEGHIECGGDLFAKYIESSTVMCKGNVLVEEAIMHSHVNVWNHCVLNGRRSEILGGNLIVGGSLWCKKLGNLYEVPTYVAMGIPPEILIAYRSAKTDLADKQQKLNKTEERIDQLDKAIQEGHTDQRLFSAKEQLLETAGTLRDELKDLSHQISDVRTQLQASRDSIVVVEEMIYREVIIMFGMMEYHPAENGVRKTVLKAGETSVKESGFNPHDKPTLTFE